MDDSFRAYEVFYDVSKCKKRASQYQFRNDNEAQKVISHLTTWREVEKYCLDTYTLPKIRNEAHIDSMYDPQGKFKKLLQDLRPTAFEFKQTKLALKNTLIYMFCRYGSFLHIRIRSGKVSGYYVYNSSYSNPNSRFMKVDPKFKYHVQEHDKTKWTDEGSVILGMKRRSNKPFTISGNLSEIIFMFKHLEGHGLNDCDFLFNEQERLTLKKDLTDASEELVGSIDYPLKLRSGLESHIDFSKGMVPILNTCYNQRYCDIPTFNPDDIRRFYQFYSLPYCTNDYLNYEEEKFIPWDKKVPTAIFRGSFTGASATSSGNSRLKAASLSIQWASNKSDRDLLDAHITNFRGAHRGRKDMDDAYIRFVNKVHVRMSETSNKKFMSRNDQSGYKYILYIEGNVSAYRAASMFKMGSVVIWVNPPKYKLWFEVYLEHKVNVMIVKPDLSDLKETIIWLRENDREAKKIADKGLDLYDTLLSREAVEKYVIYTVNTL